MDFENLFDIGGHEREADQVKKHQKVSILPSKNIYLFILRCYIPWLLIMLIVMNHVDFSFSGEYLYN